MDNIQIVLNYFSEYGLVFLFLIVFLEYMNLPGLPAGIIMPAAGILIAGNDMDFITALVISVIAGLFGSYVLYFIVSAMFYHFSLDFFYCQLIRVLSNFIITLI